MPRKIKRNLGDHDDYNTYHLMNNYSEDELRQEYSRMRTLAKRQITAIEKSPFKDHKVIQNKEYLSINPDDLSKQELARYLNYTENFLSSKLSTVTGIREQRKLSIDRLHDRGYNFINTRNYSAFGQLMDDMRAYINNNIISSQKILDAVDNLIEKRNIKNLDRITEVIQLALEHNISLANIQKNFGFYWDNIDEIGELGLNLDRKRKYTRREIERKLQGGNRN